MDYKLLFYGLHCVKMSACLTGAAYESKKRVSLQTSIGCTMKSILLQGATMETTVTIDDELYEKALELAGPSIGRANLVQEALKTFVRVEMGKRLAELGGSNPHMQDIPRQRGQS
jgi:Arc/MetJ family transcription regulator